MTPHFLPTIDAPSFDNQAIWNESASIVESVQRREVWGEERLYSLIMNCLRGPHMNQLGGQNFEDHAHDIYMLVIDAIQKGALREPGRLLGYIRTIGQRSRVAAIKGIAWDRNCTVPGLDWQMVSTSEDAEEAIYAEQKNDIVMSFIQTMPRRDQEILKRFYTMGQSAETIMEELGLTETQFRLYKSRAKQTLVERVRSSLTPSLRKRGRTELGR